MLQEDPNNPMGGGQEGGDVSAPAAPAGGESPAWSPTPAAPAEGGDVPAPAAPAGGESPAWSPTPAAPAEGNTPAEGGESHEGGMGGGLPQ